VLLCFCNKTDRAAAEQNAGHGTILR